MTADKFGEFSAGDHIATITRLRQTCKDAWRLLDQLCNASDEAKLAAIKSEDFATAVHSVRAGLMLTRGYE
jgi:hypothetical protein